MLKMLSCRCLLRSTKWRAPVDTIKKVNQQSESDVTHLKSFQFNLPQGFEIHADKIYNDYAMEDLIDETGQVSFYPMRKKNSKRPYPPWRNYWIHLHRKMVETAGSLITRRMPKCTHAVTATGFELKNALFVLAESISHLFKVAT